jgi:hypothetical protein
LSKIGAKHSLFKNSIIMAIILEVLSHWSTDKSLCVAVPTLPLCRTIFNSSTFIAVEWKTSDQFAEQANRLQTEVLEVYSIFHFQALISLDYYLKKLALLQYYRL